MKHPSRPLKGLVVIGDGFSGESILIDPRTGLEVAPAESSKDPFEGIKLPRARYEAAVLLVEFAKEVANRPGVSEYLEASKVVLSSNLKTWDYIRQLKKWWGSVTFTASWMGVRIGDPSAAALMAAAALQHPPEVALQRVLTNVHLMLLLFDNRGEPEVRARFNARLDYVVRRAWKQQAGGWRWWIWSALESLRGGARP